MSQVAEGIYAATITSTAVADHKDGHKKILVHCRLDTGNDIADITATLWIHSSGALARTKDILKRLGYKETGLTPLALSENNLIGKSVTITAKPGTNPKYMNFDLSVPRADSLVKDKAELAKFDDIFAESKDADDDMPWNSD